MRRALLAASMAIALVGSGCARKVLTTWPELTIRVTDLDGKAIEGATVEVQCKKWQSQHGFGPQCPGSRPLLTDKRGEVMLKKQTAVWDPSFMQPSTAPQIYFEACVTAPAHVTVYTLLSSIDGALQEVKLAAGSSPCDRTHGPSQTAVGHVRAIALEQKVTGGEWTVDLTVGSGVELVEGSKLTRTGATLIVDKILSRRSANSAEVIAHGDCAKVNYFDQLAVE